MSEAQADQPDPGAYTRGERVAGWIGLAFFGLLALIALDMATGGRITGAFAGESGGSSEPA